MKECLRRVRRPPDRGDVRIFGLAAKHQVDMRSGQGEAWRQMALFLVGATCSTLTSSSGPIAFFEGTPDDKTSARPRPDAARTPGDGPRVQAGHGRPRYTGSASYCGSGFLATRQCRGRPGPNDAGDALGHRGHQSGQAVSLLPARSQQMRASTRCARAAGSVSFPSPGRGPFRERAMPPRWCPCGGGSVPTLHRHGSPFRQDGIAVCHGASGGIAWGDCRREGSLRWRLCRKASNPPPM